MFWMNNVLRNQAILKKDIKYSQTIYFKRKYRQIMKNKKRWGLFKIKRE